jgi:isopentenyldiphosphate isomerase
VSADDLVDVVDEHDVVVATVTRAEMRAKRLRHRCVAVLVRDRQHHVLVHRRSEDKDVWPGRWDLTIGGVVAHGEDYARAAARELAEEVGIEGAELRFLHHARYEDDDVREQAHLYSVTWDGPIRFVDGEVVEARWLTPAELVALLAREPFCPDALALALPRL